MNRMEARISLLYLLMNKGVMPWQWDYENYTGDNEDMVGMFYPEDISAVLQIMYFEGQRNDK